MSPEIILLDEPASALDPISTAKIEELVVGLKHRFTIVIVTHNMHQAARISDQTPDSAATDMNQRGDATSNSQHITNFQLFIQSSGVRTKSLESFKQWR